MQRVKGREEILQITSVRGPTLPQRKNSTSLFPLNLEAIAEALEFFFPPDEPLDVVTAV